MNATGLDALVIGTGIVGAAIADRLTARGLRVHVVGEHLAGGATGAGMGHVLVLDENPELFAFTRSGRDAWHALAPELPSECEWQPVGTLWVARDEGQRVAAMSMGRRLLGGQVQADLLEAVELERVEPALASGLAGALYIPGDATIYQPAAAAFLLRRARVRGAQVSTGVRVHSVFDGGVELEGGRRIEAAHVIVACGTSSGALLGDRLPVGVGPKKGQLIITERTRLEVHHHLVELGYTQSVEQRSGASVAFNVQPRVSGQLLIGSSRAYVGGRDFDRELAARMLERAFEFMPGLREVSAIRAWTGLRCAANDGRPLIGPIDTAGEVLVATGHEGYGITTALVTGDLIAGWLGHADLPAYAAAFSPLRPLKEKACA